MQERTRGSVHVSRPIHEALAVILDLPDYPRWARQVSEVTVLEQTDDDLPLRARMAMNAGILKDTLVLGYRVTRVAEHSVRVSWRLLEAVHVVALDGCYDLRATPGGGTDIEYHLTIDPGLPVVTALRHKAEAAIVSVALDDLAVAIATSPPREPRPLPGRSPLRDTRPTPEAQGGPGVRMDAARGPLRRLARWRG